MIRGPPDGQRFEGGAFDVDALGITGVDPAYDLVNEAAIGAQISVSCLSADCYATTCRSVDPRLGGGNGIGMGL